MSKVALYGHGGSGNHGCEALVRTISAAMPGTRPLLYSGEAKEDVRYGLIEVCDITGESKDVLFFDKIALKLKLEKDEDIRFGNLIKHRGAALSIGGDVYCYDTDRAQLMYVNKKLRKNGCKTALIGCSISPELLEDSAVVNDLKGYCLITAREATTYEALISAGINKNVKLIPDSAFLLKAREVALPDGFEEGNTVGVNLSPLTLSCGNAELIKSAYVNAVNYLTDEACCSIALIPHVVKENNDDRTALRELYGLCKNKDKIILVDDMKAEQIKYIISRCRAFIGTRTHATIAAYSTCVPTLVVGYSMKSEAIAKDIFGTSDGRVIRVEDISSGEELKSACKDLIDNESAYRKELNGIMPKYKERANKLKSELEDFLK